MKPERMGWSRTFILAAGAGVGTMIYTQNVFIAAAGGVLITALILHMIRS